MNQRAAVIDVERIRREVEGMDFTGVMEAAFLRYSRGEAIVPPVGELLFADPPGEVHIKYGYVMGDRHYVVKIASGFPGNAVRELPASDGLMLLFDRETGALVALLHDRGLLTDVRTAAAGAVAAKHLAPKEVERIGIIGTGVQARLQALALKTVTSCRDLMVWGRRPEAVAEYCDDMQTVGFQPAVASDAAELAASCQLIVTTTAAHEPVLAGVHLKPGTHVTAMGSDTLDKRELDTESMRRADVVVADSRSQALVRGEIAHALREGAVAEKDVVELGQVISGELPGRTSQLQITVADLTGVAVQDCAIANAVYEKISAAQV